MKHDPCCRYGGTPSHGECDCPLIARVRADERGRADSECPHLLEAAALAAVILRAEAERDDARVDADDLRGALSDSRHWHKETMLALADAEQVAARLVDVICKDAEAIGALVREVRHAVAEEIAQAIAALDRSGRTHWDGCYDAHALCAAIREARRVGGL